MRKPKLVALVTLCAVVGLAGCSSDGGDDESMRRAVSQAGISLSDTVLDQMAGSLCTFLEEGAPQIPAGDVDAAAEVLAFLTGAGQANADEAMDAIVDVRCPGVR